jgi:low affinity Fe/Cu permease
VGGHRPLFHFSDTWQFIVNTLSSIATFLTVFVIQNTQGRNTQQELR